MKSENNIPPVDTAEATAPKRPSIIALILFSVLGAVAGSFIYSTGYIMMILFAAVVIFTTSTGASFPIHLIPLGGVAVSYYFGGVPFFCVVGAIWLSAVISGNTIRRGGDFHRALMSFTFVCCAVAAVGATLYIRAKGITVDDISASVRQIFHDSMAQVLESAADAIPLETANLLIEQYEAIAESAVMYIPAVIGCSVTLCGIIALRLCGLFHNFTGSELYSYERRIARVDRVFAVIWIASLVLGAVDPGVVGACASNTMLILILPCAAAGVASYREMMERRRQDGRRGLPPSLVMLIIVFLLVSPVVGIMVLSLTGAFTAFAGKKDKDSAEK